MTHKTILRRFAALAAALAATTAWAMPPQTTENAQGSAAQAPAAPAEQAKQWKSYSYAADGFSATFPSEPTAQKQSVPTNAGTFELHAYIAEDGQAALYVGVSDYGAAASGQDPQPILDGAKNGSAANANARILSSSKITLGVYPGVSFEAESDTIHFSARIYLVGTMLYQVVTTRPVGQSYDGTLKFLDSFQLIPRTTP